MIMIFAHSAVNNREKRIENNSLINNKVEKKSTIVLLV